MTFFSLRVDRVGPEKEPDPDLKADLPNARDWGPDRVASWAEGRGIEVEWIDSAWARVRVSGPQLVQFLEAAGGGLRCRERLLVFADTYEIDSEEF